MQVLRSVPNSVTCFVTTSCKFIVLKSLLEANKDTDQYLRGPLPINKAVTQFPHFVLEKAMQCKNLNTMKYTLITWSIVQT